MITLPIAATVAPINPQLPFAAEAVWLLLSAIAVFLVAAAILGVWSSKSTLDPGARVLWTIAILAVPVMGAAMWFVVGRRATLPADIGTRFR